MELDRRRPILPSLAKQSFPTGRFEREMRDLFGVELVDHPLPRRLVLHQHWPAGWYPMRRDSVAPASIDDPGEPFPFLAVEGDGVYEIPVGPVHAGIIEPGHFRFSVLGETILNMKARLWFVHKGIERLFEGRELDLGVELAERISGDTAVGHNLAYCLAVEEATGCAVPVAARLVRALLLELERMYNHVADLGALCNDVAYGILHAHAQRIRERLLRVNQRVTGHRLLRGAIVPGGAAVRALPDIDELEDIAGEVHELVVHALGNTTVADRFTGTAVLRSGVARDLGALGYVARASGIDVDARRDHPTIELGSTLRVPVRNDGDVLARFSVRSEEFAVSIDLVRRLLDLIAGARGLPSTTAIGTVAGARAGVGIVEGWRGTIVHRVELAGDGTLTRNKIVDPSFFNWPALPRARSDDRSRLPPGEQELQPVVRRERPLSSRR